MNKTSASVVVGLGHLWSNNPRDWRYCLNCNAAHPADYAHLPSNKEPEGRHAQGIADCVEPASLRQMPYWRFLRWSENTKAEFEDWCRKGGAEPSALKARRLAEYRQEIGEEEMSHIERKFRSERDALHHPDRR